MATVTAASACAGAAGRASTATARPARTPASPRTGPSAAAGGTACAASASARMLGPRGPPASAVPPAAISAAPNGDVSTVCKNLSLSLGFMMIQVVTTFCNPRPQTVLAGFGLQASTKTHKPEGPLWSTAWNISLSITSQCWLSRSTKPHFCESLSRKLSWGPTLITSDGLSLTIPATHQECPEGRLTLTFSTFYRETEEFLVEFIAWPHWFIPIYRLKKAKKQKDDLGSQFPPSFLPFMLFGNFRWLPFYRANYTFFLSSKSNNKKQPYFFSSKKKKQKILLSLAANFLMKNWGQEKQISKLAVLWHCRFNVLYSKHASAVHIFFKKTLVPTMGTWAYPMWTK